VIPRRTWLAALAIAALASSPARAGIWPGPAAGPSSSGGPEVVFTFDDGPNPRTTGHILDTLAAHHVQGVFFMVGWRFQRGDVAGSKALVRRVLDDGHVVANHSITHAQLCQVDGEQIDHEIVGARTILEGVAAMPVPWFRVPYGSRCPHLEMALARNHVSHFHWDIDPQEWQGKSAKTTAAYVIRHLAHLEGRAVLLMHDTKPATVKALPEILGWLDAENARRTAIGRPPIRVVPGYQIAAEQIRPTLDWLSDAIGAGQSALVHAVDSTVP